MGFFVDTQAMRLRRLRQRVRAFVDLAGEKPVPFRIAGPPLSAPLCGPTQRWSVPDSSCPGKWAMITLTYEHVDAWNPKDISRFMDTVQHHARRHFGGKLPYVWVGELQQRGAVHYHILVKLPRKETKLPKPDEVKWWKHGTSKIEWVRMSGKRYLSKYTSKEAQKNARFATGMRLCGAGGLPDHARAWYRYLLCPLYVRMECEPFHLPVRRVGGYRCKNRVLSDGTSYFIPSPYIAVPYPDGKRVWVETMSMDRQVAKTFDPTPLDTYLIREDLRARVEEYVWRMWKLNGRNVDNTFTHLPPNPPRRFDWEEKAAPRQRVAAVPNPAWEVPYLTTDCLCDLMRSMGYGL